MNSILYDTPQSDTQPAAFDQTTEQRSGEDDARAEADAQKAEQVEDQEAPRLGDLGSLEE